MKCKRVLTKTSIYCLAGETEDPPCPKTVSPDGENKKTFRPDRFYLAPGYRKLPSPVPSTVKDEWKITEKVSVESEITTGAKLLGIDDRTSTTEDKNATPCIARVKLVWMKKKYVPVKAAKSSTPANASWTIGEKPYPSNPFTSVAEQSRKMPMVGKKKMQAKKKVENAANQPKNTKTAGQNAKSKPGRKSVGNKAAKNPKSFKPTLNTYNELSQEEDASRDNLEDLSPISNVFEDDWESKYDSNTLEDPVAQKQRAYASKFLEQSAGFKIPKSAPGKLIIDSKVMQDYGHVYNYQRQVNRINEQNTSGMGYRYFKLLYNNLKFKLLLEKKITFCF
jgi:hypothetical protein